MKILIFGKKRQSKDGRPFTAYVTKLTKKSGDEVTCGVKFREECGAPTLDDCPCYIDVKKTDANLSTKTIEVTDPDTGEVKDVTSVTLWVNAWTKNPDKYVDKSLDDFED